MADMPWKNVTPTEEIIRECGLVALVARFFPPMAQWGHDGARWRNGVTACFVGWSAAAGSWLALTKHAVTPCSPSLDGSPRRCATRD